MSASCVSCVSSQTQHVNLGFQSALVRHRVLPYSFRHGRSVFFCFCVRALFTTMVHVHQCVPVLSPCHVLAHDRRWMPPVACSWPWRRTSAGGCAMSSWSRPSPALTGHAVSFWQACCWMFEYLRFCPRWHKSYLLVNVSMCPCCRKRGFIFHCHRENLSLLRLARPQSIFIVRQIACVLLCTMHHFLCAGMCVCMGEGAKGCPCSLSSTLN